MTDPITLATVGTTVIVEGIRFLYEQATDLLKRRRDANDSTKPSTPKTSATTLPTNVFQGQFVEPQIDFDALAQVEPEINGLRKDLLDYADGTAVLLDADPIVLEKVDALRQLIEVVYQQRLTFIGENRPLSGPIVNSKIEVGQVLGYAAAVRLKSLRSGIVRAEAHASKVGPGGKLIGADIDTVELP